MADAPVVDSVAKQAKKIFIKKSIECYRKFFGKSWPQLTRSELVEGFV
jgi:hypothetical protein